MSRAKEIVNELSDILRSSDIPSLPWYAEPLVVIDLETTGRGDDARIVEIAAIRINQWAITDTWTTLVNPGNGIGFDAKHVHGISDQTVRDAPRLESVWMDLCRHVSYGIPVAYNHRFDRGILFQEMKRIKRSPLPPHICPTLSTEWEEWLDPLPWLRDQEGNVHWSGRFKLMEACRRHGIDPGESHRACDDATAAFKLLGKVRTCIGHGSISEVLARQRGIREKHEATLDTAFGRV